MNTVEAITCGDLHTAVDGLAHAITLLEQLPVHDKEHLDELRRVFGKLDMINDLECCGGWDEWHEVQSRVAAVAGKTRDHLFDRSIFLSAVRAAAHKYRQVNKDEQNPGGVGRKLASGRTKAVLVQVPSGPPGMTSITTITRRPTAVEPDRNEL